MEQTKLVIDESLRLYPPIWFIERHTKHDIVLNNYMIKHPSRVTICPYTMHRHPAYWDDPNRFNPQRFTSQHSHGRPRCAYVPFGHGPRVCIGKHMALLIIHTVLTTLLKHVDFELLPQKPVLPVGLVTLKPKNGMYCRVTTR